MFTPIVLTIFFAAIGLHSSVNVTFTSQDPNVLAKINPTFTQIFRPATVKSFVNPEKTLEEYQFFFTEKEYATIDQDTILLFNANIIDRTVTYHPMPCFERVGARFLYRPSWKANFTTEVELIQGENRFFRDVHEPTHVFQINATESLIYLNQMPVVPYYQVTFVCNRTNTEVVPLLTYIEKSIRYSTRYFLSLPSDNNHQQIVFVAYADLLNNRSYPIVLKAAELIAKEPRINERKIEKIYTGLQPFLSNTTEYNIILDGPRKAYIYTLSPSSSISLPAYSVKTVDLQSNVTLVPYLVCSGGFLPINQSIETEVVYNLTSERFLPAGSLRIQQYGRYTGQIDLPDLVVGQTYPVLTGVDLDVILKRVVRLIQSNEKTSSLTYLVQDTYVNRKPVDVQLHFQMTFELFSSYQLNDVPKELQLSADGLQGIVHIPGHGVPKTLSYQVTAFNV